MRCEFLEETIRGLIRQENPFEGFVDGNVAVRSRKGSNEGTPVDVVPPPVDHLANGTHLRVHAGADERGAATTGGRK